MRASGVIIAALCVSLGACASGDYFAYIVSVGQRPDGVPAQQLQLAQMTTPSPPAGPAATPNATLLDTSVPDGNGFSNLGLLWASPSNFRLLAEVDEVGPDFHDQDLDAWDMLGVGVRLPLVNELSVAAIVNRKACPSAAFAAYLSQVQGSQAYKDSIDYSVPMDLHTIINLPAPQISGWVDDTSVALSWTLPFNTTDGASLQDTFHVIVTWPWNGDSATIVCVNQLPAVPHPPTALSADPTIRLRGVPVKWPPNGQPLQTDRRGEIAGVIKP